MTAVTSSPARALRGGAWLVVVVVCFGSPLTADGNVRSQPEHLMRLLLSCRAAGLLPLLLQLLLVSLPVVLHMKHHYAQISKPTWQPTDI